MTKVRCPACARTVRAYQPSDGDGSALQTFRHKTKKRWCRGGLVTTIASLRIRAAEGSSVAFRELEQRTLAAGAEREPVEKMSLAEKYGDAAITCCNYHRAGKCYESREEYERMMHTMRTMQPKPLHFERKPWTCRCDREHAADVELCRRCKELPPWPPKAVEDNWNELQRHAAAFRTLNGETETPFTARDGAWLRQLAYDGEIPPPALGVEDVKTFADRLARKLQPLAGPMPGLIVEIARAVRERDAAIVLQVYRRAEEAVPPTQAARLAHVESKLFEALKDVKLSDFDKDTIRLALAQAAAS